jgi:tRNA-dihydrouridine synthase B
VVNYKIIKEVKDALSIPVIASGDGLSPQLIKKMFDETGCDGVAVARGSLGNPWIFSRTEKYLRTGKLPKEPDLDELISTMIHHLESYCQFYGERIAVIVFRKFFNWYSREKAGVKQFRNDAFKAKAKDEMIEIINKLRAV